jgi:hypothetical protein
MFMLWLIVPVLVLVLVSAVPGAAAVPGAVVVPGTPLFLEVVFVSDDIAGF